MHEGCSEVLCRWVKRLKYLLALPKSHPKFHFETLGETLELRIITLLKQNPRLAQRELSEQLATIKRTMVGIVERNILERKDGKRYGYWEINIW